MAEILQNLVLTHHSGDLNVDRRATCDAVLTALRPPPGGTSVTILAFETASSNESNAFPNDHPIVANWFEDASPGLSGRSMRSPRTSMSCGTGRTRGQSAAFAWRPDAGG